MRRAAVARPREGARGRTQGPGPTPTTAPAASTLTTRQLAWLVAVPCAVVVLLAIVVLGPPLGRVLFAQNALAFWESDRPLIHPEPTEQARFLLALCAPLLLTGGIVALARRPLRRTIPAASTIVWAVEAAAVAFAVVCLVAQRRFVYGALYETARPFHQAYFTSATLAASLVVAVALLAATRDARARARFAAWTHESRARGIAAAALAVLLVAIWQLHAFNTEGTIVKAHFAAAYHIQFTLDETAAVLDGRTPLVNFAAQYGFLWPYPVAAAMALLGTTVGTFSAIMCLLSALAMLAMYGTLRRVTRSGLTALLLFGPFLATSYFLLRGPLADRYTFATIFSAYPMRFAGPWLLAWLLARHLGGARPRASWPLFLVAGLVAANNTDHGIPALAAVLAALLWTSGRPSRAGLRGLATQLAIGLLGAIALVSALTLLRAGSLPHPALLFRFARLFASAGFAMLPMPTLGLHTVIYLTFVAAIGAATVRALDDHPDRILTGLLAWSGVFGLAAGSYYVGRSHPEVLIDSFGIWAFATALLLVVVLRRLAARPSGWPTPAEVACAIAFGLAACSLAQTPTPWSQLHRLRQTSAPIFKAPYGQDFVAAHTHRGESVAILMLLGHRMGDTLGIADVAPYTGSESMPAVVQLTETVRALRDAGGRKLFLSLNDTHPELVAALARDGFRLGARDAGDDELWIDGPRDG